MYTSRRFTLITDHKLLTAIFHPEKGVPAMTAVRLQRYALFMAGFDYKIEYKSTTERCNVDGLSRLPLQQKELEEMGVDSSEVFHATQFVPLPVTSEAVARETRHDPVLARVHESIVKGWSACVEGSKNLQSGFTCHYQSQHTTSANPTECSSQCGWYSSRYSCGTSTGGGSCSHTYSSRPS